MNCLFNTQNLEHQDRQVLRLKLTPPGKFLHTHFMHCNILFTTVTEKIDPVFLFLFQLWILLIEITMDLPPDSKSLNIPAENIELIQGISC